jgi:hypothetical protein
MKLEGEAAEDVKAALAAVKHLVVKLEADEKVKAEKLEADFQAAKSAYEAIKAEVEAIEKASVVVYVDLKQFISTIREIVAKL